MTESATPRESLPEPQPADTAPSDGRGNGRDWIVPAALLGGLLLLLVVFGAGFLVGNATADDAPDAVVVGVHPPDVPGFGFGGHGPGGRFAPEDLDELGDRMRERICALVDSGRIPEDNPFADRLAELCE